MKELTLADIDATGVPQNRWFRLGMEAQSGEAACKTARTKPNLSVAALVSFIASFAVARASTSVNPDAVLFGGGFHIHHFWYGLAMLAVGGWLGISYESERVSRLAAILFGAGGGLIGDEVGLLLTLGDYWSEITYTLVVVFLAFASIIILVNRYSRIIRGELAEFLSSNAPLYVGVFLAAVSIAFVLETENPIIIAASSVAAFAAFALLLAYFINRIRMRR